MLLDCLFVMHTLQCTRLRCVWFMSCQNRLHLMVVNILITQSSHVWGVCVYFAIIVLSQPSVSLTGNDVAITSAVCYGDGSVGYGWETITMPGTDLNRIQIESSCYNSSEEVSANSTWDQYIEGLQWVWLLWEYGNVVGVQ